MPREPQTSERSGTPRAAFDAELREAMLRLRGALTELLASIGADSSRPQVMSRQFGINRNMAWKLSRIVHAPDPLSAVTHLPGHAGLKILLTTCRRFGAPEVVSEAVTEAAKAFHAVVRRHAGDRVGLDALLTSGADGDRAADLQEPSRRLSFQGNSAIWGVQARLQFAIHVHTPSAAGADLVDGTSVGGLLGFQRLRRTANWPLMRLQGLRHDEQGRLVAPPTEALDPDASADGPPLVEAFSTLKSDQLHARAGADSLVWELREGAVGRTGTVDCTLARRARALGGQWAAPNEESAWSMVPLFTPVQAVQLDLLLHRSLSYVDVRPVVRLFSRLEDGADLRLSTSGGYELPVAGRLDDLGSAPPALPSPLSARHAELVGWTLGRLGFPATDFRAWRLVLAFPPIPSSPALQIRLPDRPSQAVAPTTSA